ncbi:MAG: DUF1565 domain-containing protein, partial [Ramlibacter sp.]|nr:DUF1565 domain-containing protein [Ramlibacter sp.]
MAHLATATDFFGHVRRVRDGDFRVDAGANSFATSGDPPAEATLPQGSGFLYKPDPLSLFVDPCENVTIYVATVYVSASNGSDTSCTGAVAAPFATIRFALRRVPANGVVVVLPGRYDEGQTTIGKAGVTVRGVNATSRPTIRSSPLRGGDVFSVAAERVTLEDLEVVGGYTFTVSLKGRMATIRNCLLHGGGTAVVGILRSAALATVEGCVIRNSGQRIPRQGDGVFVQGASWVRIANNTLTNIRSTAVHVRE